MAPKNVDREYDIVVVGATGYTGALTVEHITEHLPADLKWAIAGRTRAKLDALAQKVKKAYPDRTQPVVEAVLFERDQLVALLKKTRVCISVVSYHSAGDVVIQACVESGTDYVDTCGDIAHIRDWIDKYHEKAKTEGIILVHSLGCFSAPQDLLTRAVVQELEDQSLCKTQEVVLSVINVAADPSGGTIDSMMDRQAHQDPKLTEASREPWFLSPVKGTDPRNAANSFGMRHDAHLGELSATSIGASQNRSIVHRTWGLLDEGREYGEQFQYNEYKKVPSTLTGILAWLYSSILSLVLSSSLLMAIIKKFLPPPGSGPDLEKAKKSRVDLEAVAIAEVDGNAERAPRAYAKFSFVEGGPYYLTAAFLAQGAASLLYERRLEGGVEGGCLTPAFLGEDLLERMQEVGGDIRRPRMLQKWEYVG